MSYSTREIGVPSMVATGAGAGAAALSVAAGVAPCWPFPQAVITTTSAVTVAIRIHGVLKNWLIWSSTQKKSDYGQVADAPGGGSLASTGASHQFLMRYEYVWSHAASPHQPGGAPASIGGQRFNRQRVDIGLQEVCHRSVNQPMP